MMGISRSMQRQILNRCQLVALLTVPVIIGANYILSLYTGGRVYSLSSDKQKCENPQPSLRKNTGGGKYASDTQQLMEARNQAIQAEKITQDFSQLEDLQRTHVPHIRSLNLTYTGTYQPPRSNLLRRYHDILNASLGDISNEYKVPSQTPYDERRRHAQHMCNVIPNSNKGVKSTLKHLWYLKDVPMLYCSVAKVGSSFWRRTWKAITSQRKYLTSPYQYSFEDFRQSKHEVNLLTRNVSSLNYFFDTSLKFMFTRDPYARIFSAYIDKLLSPNTYFWSLGKHIISKFRKGAGKRSERCGHDFTFGEFVKYIISTPTRHLNDHFIPVSEVCDVCSVQYDVIGKMETFKDDSLFLLDKVDVLGNRIKFKHFGIEYTVDSVIDLVTRTFKQRKKLERCMSFHVALRRLWRQFQISGTIQKEEQFPLTPEQIIDVTEVEIINLVLAAYKQTTKMSKLNKKEAFISAYQQVSLADLELLRQKYAKDFMLFDYDEKPDEIFDRSVKSNVIFDYFDVLKE